MDRESQVFGSLTALMIVGLAVLIAGVAWYGNTVLAVGGVLAIGAVLLMAYYVSEMPAPEESGH